MSRFTMIALAALSSAVLAASSSASRYAPGKPVTVQMQGPSCSVTASAPVFISSRRGWVMDYGGGVSCARGLGEKTLQVCDQVKHSSKWLTIKGSCVDQGPLTSNPVRLKDKRTVFLGHAYRVHAAGEVQFSTLSGSAVANGGAFAP
jgi:hypothetical protein